MSIEVEFQRAKAFMFWAQERLDGRQLPGLPTIKRHYDAGRDRFPSVRVMVDDLEKVGLSLTHVKKQWWNTLCSYTHTGYQQIGARLTSEGLGSNYKDEEVEMALKMSSNFSLVTVMQCGVRAYDTVW